MNNNDESTEQNTTALPPSGDDSTLNSDLTMIHSDNRHKCQPFAISVAEFCELSGIGKTLTYELIKDDRLRVLKINRRTLITMESVEALLSSSTKH